MLQANPQGMKVDFEDSLRGTLALGLLEADSCRLEPLPAEFEQERDRLLDRLVATYAGRQPSDIPGVAETRTLFHRLDMDPTRTRPSSEALLRRVLQGKGLPRVNPAVDVCNLCSLELQLPLGLYDREVVRGTVSVRIGREGEGYVGIRKQRVNLSGRLLLADDDGPFGAPTSDSARTAVTLGTRQLLVAVFCPQERAGEHLTGALERLAGLFTGYCSATIAAVRVLV